MPDRAPPPPPSRWGRWASSTATSAPARSTPCKQVFIGGRPLAATPAHVFGVISLIFWSLMVIVTLKYVLLLMRADNHGEGGIMALVALVQRVADGRTRRRPDRARRARRGALLRRRHDHPGDLGAVRGRGPGGRRARLRAATSCRSRWPCWCCCSSCRAAAPAGSGILFGPVMVVWFARDRPARRRRGRARTPTSCARSIRRPTAPPSWPSDPRWRLPRRWARWCWR